MFRILANLEPMINSELCQEPCHIENYDTFRILTYLGLEEYSEPCLFIANSGILITLTFFFFTLTLHAFQQNLNRRIFFTIMA